MGSRTEALQARARRNALILRVVELAPIVIVLFVLFGGALVLAVLQSLGFAPWYGINTFPDFRYFAELWGSSAFWVSLGLTLYYGFVSTIIALVMAIALSLALIKPFRGKTFYKYLYKLPLMIPYTVGIALAVIMLGNGGVLSRMLAFRWLYRQSRPVSANPEDPLWLGHYRPFTSGSRCLS